MMNQFYVSRHAGGVTYLCQRNDDNPWYGFVVKRLDKPEPPDYPVPPAGYTAEELEKDNPFNQWLWEK